MAKHTVSATQVGAKTAARGPGIFAAAAAGCRVVEVGVESTTAVSSQVALRRATANPTPGTALDEVDWDGNLIDTQVTAYQVAGADLTLVAGNIRTSHLPAAIGGGVIWTFGPQGLIIPEGTGNGLVLTLPGGSDAIINFYFDWEE